MNDEPTFDPRRKAAIRDLVVSNAAAHPGRAGGRKRTALVVTLVLLAVSISGGGVAYALGTGLLDPKPVAAPTETPTPTPTPTATPAPTSTPTPTATAPVQDPADPSTWVIGFESVGPVALGTPFRSQHDAVPTFADVTDSICVDVQAVLQSPTNLWFYAIGAQDDSGRTATIEFGNLGVPDRDDRAVTPKTPEGIGISSTLAELMAAYPGIERTGGYSDSVDYYGLTDGHGGWIVFAVMRDVVWSIQVGNQAVLPYGMNSVRAIPPEHCPA
ncbi:hypothetical protein [Leifsonia sp. LS-T14]|uniref:hypothetical protein n=1 Tax=unclassified Leifsonia TaxID=2663824 RepID=UPI0035A60C43